MLLSGIAVFTARKICRIKMKDLDNPEQRHDPMPDTVSEARS